MRIIIIFLCIFLAFKAFGQSSEQSQKININVKMAPPDESILPSIRCKGLFTKVCHVRLPSAFYRAEKFEKVLAELDLLDENDTVYFHLRGTGGRLSIVRSFYNSMKIAQYKSISIVDGHVYSAHAMFAMMTDEVIIGHNLFFMFHRPRIPGVTGSINQYCNSTFQDSISINACIDELNMSAEVDKDFLNYIVEKALTKEQLERYHSGADVYVSGDDLRKRLEKQNAK